MKKSLFALVFILFSISLISAVPGIPHQFYGNVEVNGKPANNNIIVASVNGQEYSTLSDLGEYGFSPNDLLVKDPEGDNLGRLITFYIGGKEAGSFTFQSNGFTNLDFSLNTSCGDSYCLGSETCSNCEEDCGVCTEKPEIFIESPLDKELYNTSKIDVKVFSDQKIIIWMYSINDAIPEVFIPNITLTLETGEYDLEIIGMNNNHQSNSEKISFEVDAPKYCGDGICSSEIGENCNSCYQDCGSCNTGGGNKNNKNSGGSPGGGVISNLIEKLFPSENSTENDNSDLEIGISEENSSETNPENLDNKNFFSRITGKAISFGENTISLKFIIIILGGIIVLVVVFVVVKRKKKSKKLEKPDEKINGNTTQEEPIIKQE